MNLNLRSRILCLSLFLTLPALAISQGPPPHGNNHELPNLPHEQQHGNHPDQNGPPRDHMQHVQGEVKPEELPPRMQELYFELDTIRQGLEKSGGLKNKEELKRLNEVLNRMVTPLHGGMPHEKDGPPMMDGPRQDQNNHQLIPRDGANPEDLNRTRNRDRHRDFNFGGDESQRLGERLIRNRIMMQRMIDMYKTEMSAIEEERQNPNANNEQLNQREANAKTRRDEILNRFRETSPEMLEMVKRAEKMVGRLRKNEVADKNRENVEQFKQLLQNIPEDNDKLFEELAELIESSPFPPPKSSRFDNEENNQAHLERINKEIKLLERRIEHLKIEKKYLEEGEPPLPSDTY